MSLKKLCIVFFFFGFAAGTVFSQHTVNDIKKYGGWYKVKIEIVESGNTYNITQCYPSGEEYEVTGIEKEKLPVYLKVLCMGMVEDGLKDSFNFSDMTFEEDGIFVQLAAFSLTFIFNFSKSEAEILEEIGAETVNKYRYRRWQ